MELKTLYCAAWILLAIGLTILTVISIALRVAEKKQEFGAENDLVRTAVLCVYTALAMLLTISIGSTVKNAIAGAHQDVSIQNVYQGTPSGNLPRR